MPDLKVCTQCLAPLPLDQFRPRSKAGGLSSNCRKCHAAEMTEQRLLGRTRIAKKFASKIRRARDHREVCRIAKGAVAAFHGLPGFCRAWQEAVTHAKSGTLAATNLLAATARLIEVAQPDRKAQERRRELMTDEELEEKIRETEQRMFAAAREQLAKEAANANASA